MALSVTDSTSNVTNAINNMYMRTFLTRALPLCPYFAGSVAGELSKNASTATVKWRRLEKLAPSTSALSQVTTAAYMQGRTPQELTVTDVTATVQKYGEFVILNEEVADFEANPLIDDTMGNLGEIAGQSANRLQRNILEDNLTARYAGNVASAGAVVSKVTLADIKAVLQTLRTNNARQFTPMTQGSENIGTSPILPAYWGFCHPDMADDIAGLGSSFVSVEQYAGQIATVPGEIGTVKTAGAGVRVIETSEATVDANAGGSLGSTGLNSTGGSLIDLYTLVIIGQDCHGSVGFGERHTDGVYRVGEGGLNAIDIKYKPIGSGGTSDPFDEISTLAYKFWHAGAVLNGNFGRAIVAGATNV